MKFQVIDNQTVYRGFFKMERYRLVHELFEGGESRELVRELLQRGDAAAVLPYDPENDCVVLVEQFRIGAINDPHGPWLVETIAGMVEEGEPVDELVRREAIEEADCSLTELVPICDYYCSPGGSSEKIHLFCARTDSTGLGGVYGCADEGEDIKVHIIPFERLRQMLADNKINTAMTLIAVQWLMLNRDKLRQNWL